MEVTDMRHDEQPTKYCLTCETHFRACPDVHEDVYHDDGEWCWTEQTARRFRAGKTRVTGPGEMR